MDYKTTIKYPWIFLFCQDQFFPEPLLSTLSKIALVPPASVQYNYPPEKAHT